MRDTRRQLLDSAREEFLSPEYDLLSGVVMERVAKRAGVPLRTAKRELKADELRTALMEDLLRVRPGEAVDSEQFAKFIGQLLDRSEPLGAQMGNVVDALVEQNEQSEIFRAMIVFWALSQDNQDVQDRIRAMYTYWLRGGRNAISALLVERSASVPLRTDWINIEDFMRSINAVIEGLAIQRTVAPTDDGQLAVSPDVTIAPMDPELARKVMLSVFASMIDLDGVHSVEQILQQLPDRTTS